MNERQTDFELLRNFTRQGDQPAFAAVVRRHLDLVYATALRKAEDEGAAQEIAQNVFATLARKAWQFAPDDSLPAWLYKTTLLEAREWLRGELRRRRREQTAAELGTTMKTPEEQSALRALVPLLDEALLSLREKDRTALLLRFYESRSLRDVGVSLGVGEEAAQKRVGSALEKLAQFFQRRGFKTASIAATTAALQQTAAAAPAAVAASVLQAGQQLVPPALGGLAGWFSRIAGLTRTQSAVCCTILALAPVAWQWNRNHAARKTAVIIHADLDDARIQQQRTSAEIARLRAESARLDSAFAAAARAQVRVEDATRKLEQWKARLRTLLTDPDYRWPDDLPYVHIPKGVVKDDLLHLRNKHPGGAGEDFVRLFDPSGVMTDSALELLAIDPQQKSQVEQSLSDYWRGVEDLMAARAYETNVPGVVSGRLTRTIVIPPLGSELKALAEATRQQITQQLGAEREQMLFGGWDEGAIQIFWPGNLWKITDEAQQFSVWQDRAAAAGQPAYGIGWHVAGGGGISTDGERALSAFPRAVATQFFVPWLQQSGVAIPDSITYFGDHDE